MRTHPITRTLCSLFLIAVLASASTAPASAGDETGEATWGYVDAIDRVEAMAWTEHVWELTAEHGLDMVNVAWEDTGRYDNSSVGPNISDVTIQVPRPIPGTDEHTLALMPVLRHPNFTDRTGDVPIHRFTVPVGNEVGEPLRSVTLEEYLGNIGDYLSAPGRWDRDLNLLAPRDTHVLVSAQAAFLPVPEQGLATFNPVIFNYQSWEGNPAVLTIVVTREGTSATIIDNVRDGFASGGSWGQRLFFNDDGQRASLTGERASDVEAVEHQGDAEVEFAPDPDHVPNPDGRAENAVLIIQVPLKHDSFLFEDWEADDALALSGAPEAEAAASDVEDAVIGHGPVEGPFTELDGLAIERDPDFPVRVTVQFYKATATGEVSEADVARIAESIDRVYDDADWVGSLVTDGLLGRPTGYAGSHEQPYQWWAAFFGRLRTTVLAG